MMKSFIGPKMNIASPSKDIVNTTLSMMIMIIQLTMEKLHIWNALIHTLRMESR